MEEVKLPTQKDEFSSGQHGQFFFLCKKIFLEFPSHRIQRKIHTVHIEDAKRGVKRSMYAVGHENK
jgi:hypothetical protein